MILIMLSPIKMIRLVLSAAISYSSKHHTDRKLLMCTIIIEISTQAKISVFYAEEITNTESNSK